MCDFAEQSVGNSAQKDLLVRQSVVVEVARATTAAACRQAGEVPATAAFNACRSGAHTRRLH